MPNVNDEVTENFLEEIKKRKIETFEILFIDNINVSSSLRDTLVMDKIGLTREEREKLPAVRTREIGSGKGIRKGPDRHLQEASTRRSSDH